ASHAADILLAIDLESGVDAAVAAVRHPVLVVVEVSEQLVAVGALVARAAVDGRLVASKAENAVRPHAPTRGDRGAEAPPPVVDEIRVIEDLAAAEGDLDHRARVVSSRVSRAVGERLLRGHVGVSDDRDVTASGPGRLDIDEEVVLRVDVAAEVPQLHALGKV